MPGKGFGLFRSHTKFLVIWKTSSTAATTSVITSFTNKQAQGRQDGSEGKGAWC